MKLTLSPHETMSDLEENTPPLGQKSIMFRYLITTCWFIHSESWLATHNKMLNSILALIIKYMSK